MVQRRGRRFADDGTTGLQRRRDRSSFGGATAKSLARAVKCSRSRAYRLVLQRTGRVKKKNIYLTTTDHCCDTGFAIFWCLVRGWGRGASSKWANIVLENTPEGKTERKKERTFNSPQVLRLLWVPWKRGRKEERKRKGGQINRECDSRRTNHGYGGR